MNFFRTLDLYKGLILGCLLLLPAAGYWIYSLQKRIEDCNRSIIVSTRAGGTLEQIGQLQRKMDTIKSNRNLLEQTKDPGLYFDEPDPALGQERHDQQRGLLDPRDQGRRRHDQQAAVRRQGTGDPVRQEGLRSQRPHLRPRLHLGPALQLRIGRRHRQLDLEAASARDPQRHRREGAVGQAHAAGGARGQVDHPRAEVRAPSAERGQVTSCAASCSPPCCWAPARRPCATPTP